MNDTAMTLLAAAKRQAMEILDNGGTAEEAFTAFNTDLKREPLTLALCNELTSWQGIEAVKHGPEVMRAYIAKFAEV